MVEIVFTDGTTIEAETNGNCYITDDKPLFPSDCEIVLVKSEDKATTLRNVEIIDCASVDGKYWFVMVETPQSEIEKEKADAQLMYTALMTDTLIEEE